MKGLSKGRYDETFAGEDGIFTDRSNAVISVLFLLCRHACLFIDALWSPAGKGLLSWLSFVMSNCDIITFPLVSWVRCGA